MNILTYLPAMAQLPKDSILEKSDLLNPAFLIEIENQLSMYYAPHNEYINHDAKVVIVGITPGWTQMRLSFETFVRIIDDVPYNQALQQVKEAASFAGSMRKNLITMLDECLLSTKLEVESCSLLFSEKRDSIHTTSLIKYPVFYKGKNYTGHHPTINQSALLSHYVYNVFPKELASLSPNVLLIPLGSMVEETLKVLTDKRKIKQTYLSGFPHPSGANGHRIKQFNERRSYLKEQVESWKIVP